MSGLMFINVYNSVERHGPCVTNRSGGSTIGAVYCQHLVVTKDGAINDHHRGASVLIDAATLECTSVSYTHLTLPTNREV